MSFGTVSISPYIKEYSKDFKSQESSLSSYNLLRHPGTTRPFLPHKEATGKYRTGLDEKAQYLNNLSKEDRDRELGIIKSLKEKLTETFPGVDLSPTSKIWNVWSNEPVKASKINASNSPIYLHPDINPEDLLTYAWVRVSPSIAKSRLAIENGECPNCQYYISDEKFETTSLFKKKIAVNKATKLLEELRDNPTKIKKVARLMGLPMSEDTSIERTYVLLDNELKETTIKSGENTGRGTVSLFNEICELTEETLNAKDLVERCLRHNIYRLTGDKITEGTVTIADSKADFAKYLLKPENQKEFIALQIRLKNKESVD